MEQEDLIRVQKRFIHPLNYYACKVTPVIENIQVNDVQLDAWKMNLMAVYPPKRLLFIAQLHSILVYTISKEEWKREGNVKNPLTKIELDNGDSPINQIKIDLLDGNIPVLMTVDDGGEIRIIFIEDLQRKFLYFTNHGISTWGCSISNSGLKIGVSANSHDITIWDLQGATLQRERIVLSGHENNIPCVAFSPCGKYIASTSIDGTCRLWDLSTERVIAGLEFGSDWGWSVTWIKKNTIKVIKDYKQFWDEFELDRSYYIIPGLKKLNLNRPRNNQQQLEEDYLDELEMDLQEALDAIQDAEDIEEGEEDEGEEYEGEQFEDQSENEQFEEQMIGIINDQQNEEREISSEGEEESIQMEEEDANLLIIGTARHLILCDEKFNVLSILYHVVTRPIQVPNWMARLSMIHYIPALSLIVIGSQGLACVRLVRIVRDKHSGKYELIKEQSLPNPTLYPLVGLSVHEVDFECYHIYVIYQNACMTIFEVKKGNPHFIDITTLLL